MDVSLCYFLINTYVLILYDVSLNINMKVLIIIYFFLDTVPIWKSK